MEMTFIFHQGLGRPQLGELLPTAVWDLLVGQFDGGQDQFLSACLLVSLHGLGGDLVAFVHSAHLLVSPLLGDEQRLPAPSMYY